VSDSIRRGAARDSGGWLRTWGWITTILLWPVGLVLAIVLVTRGDRKHGGWMLGICLAWVAGVAVVFVSAASQSGASTATQLQVDLPRAITEDSGDTFTNVTCVNEGGNVFECVGEYRLSDESARSSLEEIGYPEYTEQDVREWRRQQSGTVTFRVIASDDGAITWRPV